MKPAVDLLLHFMQFVLLAVLLFAIELAYFQLADRLNIIDKPNQRSSHRSITLRGGGVLFPISLLLYFLFFGFQYPWFLTGLMAISAISFADDVKAQSKRLRIVVHLLAVSLLLFQAGLLSMFWFWLPVALVMCIGVINAYNFMDGINGITGGYSLVIALSLWMVNRQQQFIDPDYLYCLGMGVLVFSFFNFRKRAKCFAGDVGSVSIAFSLIFPLLLLIIATGNFLFILFFALYGVDTVLTILHRLSKRENIFDAHRQHLFQYLANEGKMPHVSVSALYMVLQALINLGIIYCWQHANVSAQVWFAVILLAVLAIIHTALKFSIIRRYGQAV